MSQCPGPRRREFLQGICTAAIIAAIADFSVISTAGAQTTLTPDAAVQRMIDGNARYVAQRLEAFNENLDILRQDTEEKQEPFAAVLSCADSRVPVEIIFDQTIGHLFVTRVAGNVATTEIIASLEYGAAVLGTSAIMVLGHAACGAVKAAIAGKEVPGQISTLFVPLRSAVVQSGPDLEGTIKTNARIQAKILNQASPVLAGLIKAGRLKVVAAYYDLRTGRVELLT